MPGDLSSISGTHVEEEESVPRSCLWTFACRDLPEPTLTHLTHPLMISEKTKACTAVPLQFCSFTQMMVHFLLVTVDAAGQRRLLQAYILRHREPPLHGGHPEFGVCK